MKLSPSQLRELYVAEATRKFASNVPDFVALQAMVAENGGRFHNDHGAIRTADPAVTALFTRAAGALGLQRDRNYTFPAKKLKSFDLQVIGEDAEPFKIFVSQVDLSAFPDDVAELIREDCVGQAAAMDPGSLIEKIERAENDGGLSEPDAHDFIAFFVDCLMSRTGPPMQRSTLERIAVVSGEAASALALGPDFNHITIDVRAAGYADIEAMAAAMQDRGFHLLPQIQGARGTQLRQTATMAATMNTPVRELDGSLGHAATEKQFVEIIERGQAVNDWGGKLWRQDGRPLIFRNFLAANAEKIFDAASTRARS